MSWVKLGARVRNRIEIKIEVKVGATKAGGLRSGLGLDWGKREGREQKCISELGLELE